MANIKANKFLKGLQNTKARTLLVLGVVIVIIAVIIIYFATRKTTPLGTEESKAGKVPLITAIPGGVTSERYQQLQEEENRKRAEQAKKTGGSEVSTIIGSRTQAGLASKERFGIEDILAKQCAQPTTGCPPEQVGDLFAQMQAAPEKGPAILKANPCLLNDLCKRPDMAVIAMDTDEDAAKMVLNACPNPEISNALAEKNPAFFKKLMLDNPDLANKLAAANPDLFKKLILEDPEFAKALAATNPALLKKLMKDDPDFARQFAAKYPDIMKKLLLDDPEFAKAMAELAPDMLKKLILDDPAFAKALAAKNPALLKKLMKDDPDFARQFAAKYPDMMKKLLLDDPEFARAMAISAPDVLQKLMQDDPDFAAQFGQKYPTLANVVSPTAVPLGATVAPVPAIELTQAQQKQVQDLEAAMETQAKTAISAWGAFTPQQFVQGEWAQKKEVVKKATTTTAVGPEGAPLGAVAGEGAPSVLFKAGTVVFATLDTTISSDEPGPIMATVIQGKFNGAKLLGTFTGAPQPGGLPPTKVVLNFTTLNIPSFPRSLSIQAVAIDPDTARTAFASEVDRHFLVRYGSILASSFLVGYAKVITSQGSVQTSSANGLQTTTTAATLDKKKQIMAAFGEVGKKLADSWKQYADIPPTITVDCGTCLGILFLTDVSGP